MRSPRPRPLHARLTARVVHRLYGFVQEAGIGEVLAEPGILLARDPDTVRGPDVAYYSRERIPEAGYATGFWGAPDLAVEITSPGNRVSEIQEKVTEYLDAGVRLVWVIDPPTRTVTAYAPDGSARILRYVDTLDGGDVVPGFRFRLAELFAG